jgi:hypothetical protein
LLKKIPEGNGGRRPDFPIQAFKINVAASQQQSRQDTNRSMDRLEKTTSIEATIGNNTTLQNIIAATERFERESASCNFE